MSESHQEFSIDALHPICFSREDVDNQLLVFRFPPSARWMCVNDRLDIVLDVFLLSSLVMEGNIAGNQGIENILDISFRSAGDAYAQIRKLGFDEHL